MESPPKDPHRKGTRTHHEAGKHYVHQALDQDRFEIRLLRLRPAQDHDSNVHCNLITIPLAEGPRYEALSYTWGDQREEGTVSIDDSEFHVTANLHTALRYLRTTDRDRILWVDAMCINQSDNEEKSQQVSQMDRIYSSASGVLIWLGPSDSDIARTITYFVANDKPRWTRRPNNHMTRFPEDETQLTPLLPGLKKLVNNPWFSRMWVMQELVLARKYPCVCCGVLRISWENLNSVLFSVAARRIGQGSAIEGPFRAMDEANLLSLSFMYQDLAVSGKTLDFQDLMVATSDRKCKDPRDKVFALLGLAPDQVRAKISPDYNSSIRTVFQRAMLSALESRGNLHFLEAATTSQPSESLPLPSWCVNFSRTDWFERFQERGDSFRHDIWPGTGSSITQSALDLDVEKGRLYAEGTLIGRVDHVTPMRCGDEAARVIESGTKGSTDLPAVSEALQPLWEDLCSSSLAALKILSVRLGDAEAVERLQAGDVWKTMAYGESLERIDKDMWHRLGLKGPDDYSLLERFAQQHYHRPVPWASELHHPVRSAESAESTNFSRYILATCGVVLQNAKEHAFVATDSGYMANCNAGVSKNDVLCVLFGCRQPAVLSPYRVTEDSGKKVYKLKSLAYADGAMSGELLRGEKYERQTFALE